MNNQIKVFPVEIRDGLQEVIASNSSVAHCSPVSVKLADKKILQAIMAGNKDLIEKVLAENADQRDLFYLESVLVSTGWNKNDDVFRNNEMWEARSTPEDKQFNFQHDENDIIGHITGCYVEVDGEIVSHNEASEDFSIPNDFNIIAQAVLYNSWTTAKNIDRMGKIISEIEAGEWFVSMECLFSGFDYAVTDPSTGSSELISRNQDSAFLTKHLRSYGGTGEYQGFKIGRALRNIAFSGVGLVSQPANPKSVILNSKSVAFQTDESTNFSSLLIGESDMSDDFLKKQIDELNEALVAAKTDNEVLAKAKVASEEEAQSAMQSKDETLAEMKEAAAQSESKLTELQEAFDAQAKELTETKAEMDEMKKKETEAKRKAQLVEAGFTFEEGDETIATFFSLDEEAFNVILAKFAAEAAKNWPPKDDEDEEEDKEKEAKSEEVTQEVEVQTEAEEVAEAQEAEAEEAEAQEVTAETFEGVESSEATLVEAEEIDEASKVRASVSEWLSQNVL